MNTKQNDAIGGYFELEPGNGSGLALLESAATYQSARSAMAAAFLHVNPATVWVPHFICGVVIEMLDTLGSRRIAGTLIQNGRVVIKLDK